MELAFVFGLPFKDISDWIDDKSPSEVWISSAYFSFQETNDLIAKIETKLKKAKTHIIFSSSSVNPLHEIEPIISRIISDPSIQQQFDFSLMHKPLMHAKLFSVRYEDKIRIYIGSANLTYSAITSNIETGIKLELNRIDDKESYDKCINFLAELQKKCNTNESILKIQSRAMFSHFRSELLFLALDESKLSSLIYVAPTFLKSSGLDGLDRAVEDSENDGEDESIKANPTIKIKNIKTTKLAILKQGDIDSIVEKKIV